MGYDFGKEAEMRPGINRFGFAQDAPMADYVSWNQRFSGFAPPSPSQTDRPKRAAGSACATPPGNEAGMCPGIIDLTNSAPIAD